MRHGIDPKLLQFRGDQLTVSLAGEQDALRRFLLALHLELLPKPFQLLYVVTFTMPAIVCDHELPAPARSPAIAHAAAQMNLSTVELSMFLFSF